MNPEIAIMGGSGLYALAGTSGAERRVMETPFGPTSDPIELGTLNGVPVAFLSRHGAGHRLLPSEVPYRANIWALKEIGCTQILATTACGSLREEFKPGDLVFFHCGRRGISHVGIFVGNGKFVHASSPRSGGVRVDSLNDGYYKSTFRGARRVKK